MSDVTARTRETRAWRRIALPASIILNLFLVALIGGHVLNRLFTEATPGPPLMRAIARAEASLPPEDAARFGAVMRRDAPRFSADREQVIAARRALVGQITAEHFDQNAVRQAMATWQTAWNRFVTDFANTLVDALAQVSPEGRRKLVAERGLERREDAAP
jgi:uncharacterized membrane protein